MSVQQCLLMLLHIFFRHWNHRERQWYYHDLPQTNIVHNGYTGGSIIVILIVLLWLYSLHRLWVVWVNTLNFDGVTSIPVYRGWDLLVSWVTSSVRGKKKEDKEEMEGCLLVNGNGISVNVNKDNDKDVEEGFHPAMKIVEINMKENGKRIVEKRLEYSFSRQNKVSSQYSGLSHCTTDI